MTTHRLSTRATVTSVAAGAVAFKVPGEIIGLIEATPEQERAFAALLFQEGAVRITVEPVPPPPEPLTGGPADINVRVRIKSFFTGVPGIAGQAGTLIRYDHADRAEVRLDSGWTCAIPSAYVERAPAECQHCGASQVTR